MKKIFITLIALCIVNSNSFSQANHPYQHFKIEDGAVLFEKVYQVESLDKYQIATQLIQYLQLKKGISNILQQNETITAEVRNTVAERRSKAITFNTNNFLTKPMDYNIIILIKDGRYKVILKDFVYYKSENIRDGGLSIIPIKIENEVMKYNRNDWKTRKYYVKRMMEFQNYLTEFYQLNQAFDDW